MGTAECFFQRQQFPEGITAISRGLKSVAVFEGFTDFLSALSDTQCSLPECDYIILNSLSFFEKARPLMESHEVIYLCLDNDAAGQNCRNAAMRDHPAYKDHSGYYAGCKDYNEWLMGNA